MNDNDPDATRFDPERVEFIARLTQMSAASVPLDPQVVFYQAGFAAAMSQNRTRLVRIGGMAAAASLAGLCLVGSLAYRAGTYRSEANRGEAFNAGSAAPASAPLAQLPIANIGDQRPIENSRSAAPQTAAAPQTVAAQTLAARDSPSISNKAATELMETDTLKTETLETQATERPVDDAWWAVWLPARLQPIPRNEVGLLGDDLALGLTGLSPLKQSVIDSARTNAASRTTNSRVDVRQETLPRSPRALQPRDWQSLLPTL